MLRDIDFSFYCFFDVLGLDLQSYVPPLERILHTEEMEESGMADNEKFLYLVRVMYDDLGMTTTTDDED